MKLRSIKPLHMLLTLMLLIGMIPILHNVIAQTTARIFVDPAEITFYTDETPVGTTFDVAVKAADFGEPGVYSYELKLRYDNTMLEATAASIPDGHWLTPSSPANIFKVDPGTIDQAGGFASFAVTLLGAEEGKTGGGTIAVVTLKITASPPPAGALSSLIEVTDLILVNPDAQTIPPDTYEVVPSVFTYSAPPPPWYLKVVPEITTASSIGETVTINVTFNDALADAHITDVQFSLLYPDILTIATEDITEGDFFKSVGETFFVAQNDTFIDDQPAIIVGVGLVPVITDGTPNIDNFPSGTGTLATIKFKVRTLPDTLTTYPLTLTNVIILDWPDGNQLPYRRLESGELMAPTKLEDLNSDGQVNIQDIAIFALAFGSTPTSPRWNSKADVNRDGKVNILDGVLIAKSFGDP
jgi:hypothetical protein